MPALVAVLERLGTKSLYGLDGMSPVVAASHKKILRACGESGVVANSKL